MNNYAVDPEISTYYQLHMNQHKYLEIDLIRHTSKDGQIPIRSPLPNPISNTLWFRKNSHIPKGTIVIVPVGNIIPRKTPRCQHQYEWQPPDSEAHIIDATQVAIDNALPGHRPNMCLYIKYATPASTEKTNCVWTTTAECQFPVLKTTCDITTTSDSLIDLVAQPLRHSLPNKAVATRIAAATRVQPPKVKTCTPSSPLYNRNTAPLADVEVPDVVHDNPVPIDTCIKLDRPLKNTASPHPHRTSNSGPTTSMANTTMTYIAPFTRLCTRKES